MSSRWGRGALALLLLASGPVACFYAFDRGPLDPLEAPTPAPRPTGVASYSLRLVDTERGRSPRAEDAFEDALARALLETGCFEKVVRNDSDRPDLAPGNAHVDVEITTEESGNILPHRLLTVLTLGIVPGWATADYTLRGSVLTADAVGGPYTLENRQTIAIWLPLMFVMIPDAWHGAATGRGNSIERPMRNLFRHFVHTAERDGPLCGGGAERP